MKIPVSMQENLLTLAYKKALDSPDPSTQNGAVIWSQGADTLFTKSCNEFTAGVNISPERLDRPLKYTFIEHAERNSVFNIVRDRIVLPQDAAMVAVWAACSDCARAIVNSGIRTLVRHANVSDLTSDRWGESIMLADEIMEEGGVDIIDFYGSVSAQPVRHDGQMWCPQTLTLSPFADAIDGGA